MPDDDRRDAGGESYSGMELMGILSLLARLSRSSRYPLLLILACCANAGAAKDSRDLAGTWRFQIDREDLGLAANWANTPLPSRKTVQLPGMMQAQAYGDTVTVNTPWTGEIVDRSWFTAPEYAKYRQPGNIKIPFWLQPDRHYVGAAWYQRDLDIPADWEGCRVVLLLERPHIETRAWLDGRELGRRNSLSTPHEYELGTKVSPGKHLLTIRVDNRLVVDVGINSHSVTDHTQGNWNGIAGKLRLSGDAAHLGCRSSGVSPPPHKIGDGSRQDRQLDREGGTGSARTGDRVSWQPWRFDSADEPGVMVGPRRSVLRGNPA